MNTPADYDRDIAFLIHVLTDPADGTCGESKAAHNQHGPYDVESWLQAGAPPLNTGIYGNADERIVTPGAQGWAILALNNASAYLGRTNPTQPELANLLAGHATQLARVSIGSLLMRDHRFAALRMASSSPEVADLTEAAEVEQAILTEALLALLARCGPDDREMFQSTIESVIARFSQVLPAFVAPQDGVHLWARWLQTLCRAMAALPENPERTAWRQMIWVLTACLLEAQQIDGSWSGDLLATSQATSALTLAAKTETLAARPDTLEAAIKWISEWAISETGFPLPPPGFRCWEIPLDTVASILEASGELHAGNPVGPETCDLAIQVGIRWRTLGNHLLASHSESIGAKAPLSLIRFQREEPQLTTVGDWNPGAALRLLGQGLNR